MRFVKFSKVVANVDEVETCRLYVTAPVEAAQLSVGASDCPVALAAGEDSTGTIGAGKGGTVPKLIWSNSFTVPAGTPEIRFTAAKLLRAV